MTSHELETQRGIEHGARVREGQRQIVMLCRKHGVGRNPLTGALPVERPLLDWSLGGPGTPEFRAALAAIHAEYADVTGDGWAWPRNIVFAEAELTA